MHRHNKLEKVAAPPLAAGRLHGQVREPIPALTISPIPMVNELFNGILKNFITS
jgi:hypothetical protein